MPPGKSISSKIIRNTQFNVLGFFWFFLVYLFLTPYVISRIGIERFGVWSIISVITGYFGLLDMGFGSPFIKYIAEFYARREYARISQVVNTGFTFYALFAVLIISLGAFFMQPLIRFFKIPAGLYAETRTVFLIGVVIFAASAVFKPFEAIQGGLQRMDISNKIIIAVSIPNIAGTIFFLERGYGLVGLIINNAIIAGITITVNVILAFRISPELKFSLFKFDRETFRMVFGFGVKRWVTAIEEIVLFQTDKLLISHFLSVGLVGFYQLGFGIINKMWQLPMLLIPAVVPAASELDAMRRKEDIVRLYFKGTKYLLGFSVPLFTFFFATADLVMSVWMGPGYGNSALVIRLMAVAFLIMNFSAMGSAIAVGVGKPEFQMEAAVGQAILNLALSIFLIIKIGFAGVLIGTVVAVFLSTAYFLGRLHRYLGLAIGSFANKPMLRYFLIISAAAGIIYWANCGFNYQMLRRRFSLIFLIIEGVLFLSFYVFLLWKSNFLDKEDMQIIRPYLPALITNRLSATR